MRLRDAVQEIDSFGVEAASNFKIKASAKAFKILSSNLYSDKILAIVREIGCNALDAHIAAGNVDQPFDVQFPTIIDPHFSIKDYGTGMSHEQIMDLYTTYFQSTKTESDDYVGALGLGSKAPFSYADQFLVVSRVDGIRREYSAFLDEAGLPSIILMNTVDTRDYEHISLDDHSEESMVWENEGGSVWERLQLVHGSGESNGLEVRMPCKIGDCDKFMSAASKVFSRFVTKPNVNLPLNYPVHESLHSGSGWLMRKGINKILAIMGPIAYPISPEYVPTTFPKITSTVEVDFPIGSLDVNAGRESLSYDAITVENIASRMRDVADEIRALIQDDINEAKDYFEACQIAHNMAHFGIDWDNAGILHNGRQVYTDIRLDLLPNKETYAMEYVGYSRRRYILETADTKRVPLHTTFYYKDCAANRSDILDVMNGSGRLVSSGDLALLEEFIGKPVLLMSKLLPPKEKRIKNRVSVRSFGESKYVSLSDINSEAPLYIPTFENRPCHDNKSEDYQIKIQASVYRLCSPAKPRPIYYMPLSKVHLLPSNWKSLRQEVSDFLKECSDDQDLIGYMNDRGRAVLPPKWRGTIIKPNHYLYKFTTRINDKQDFDRIIALANAFEYKIRPGVNNDQSDIHESPWERYPLLTFMVNRGYYAVDDPLIVEYINMVDEQMERRSTAAYIEAMTDYLQLNATTNEVQGS